MPYVSYLTGLGLFGLHVILCWPAATSRGVPNLDPFWLIIAPVISYSGILFLCLFDDAERTRRRVLTAFTVLASFINEVVSANLQSPRPRIGHLVGFWGVIYYYPFEVIVNWHVMWVIVYSVGYFVERSASAFWGRYRSFQMQGGLRFTYNLAALFIVAFFIALCLGTMVIVRCLGGSSPS